jgi:hypothetical protein
MATYTQLPGSLGLSLRRGDELGTTIDFSPTTLTDYTVTAVITSVVTGEVVETISTSVSDGPNGVVSLALTETQTAALPVGTYGWRLEWDAPGNVKRTALQGVVEVVG